MKISQAHHIKSSFPSNLLQVPELHHHLPFQMEKAHPDSKGTTCTHCSHTSALLWHCNTYPHVSVLTPCTTCSQPAPCTVLCDFSRGGIAYGSWDLQESSWPLTSVRGRGCLGNLRSKLKSYELHMVEKGCKDLYPEALQQGTHLARSGVSHGCCASFLLPHPPLTHSHEGFLTCSCSHLHFAELPVNEAAFSRAVCCHWRYIPRG